MAEIKEDFGHVASGIVVGGGLGKSHNLHLEALNLAEMLSKFGRDVQVRGNSNGLLCGAFYDDPKTDPVLFWGETWYGLSVKYPVSEESKTLFQEWKGTGMFNHVRPTFDTDKLSYSALFYVPVECYDEIAQFLPDMGIKEPYRLRDAKTFMCHKDFETAQEAFEWLDNWGTMFCPRLKKS